MDRLGRIGTLRTLALVAALAGSGLSATASFGPVDARADCIPVLVPAIGPACRDADGMWRVPVGGDRYVTTHGADPVRPTDDDMPVTAVGGSRYTGRLPATMAGWPLRQPACVAKPGMEFHLQAIYAHSTDGASRYATMRNSMKIMIAGANGWLRAMAARVRRVLDYRVACSLGGVEIIDVRLTTTDANTSFGSIVRDLIAKGYTSPFAKYWIFYDGPARDGAAGVGTIRLNDIGTADNPNNFGPGYAVAFNTGLFNSMRTMMHENGHNLGAVQYSAPNSNRGGHCNDGVDVMCYYDPGAPLGSLYRERSCRSADYDCRFNDYFNPRPAKGSYLAKKWNTASPMNRFLAGCAYRTGALEAPGNATAPVNGVSTVDVAIPKTCIGRPFSVSAVPQYPPEVFTATAPVAAAMSAIIVPALLIPEASIAQIPDADVCFYKGAKLLACHERRGVVERAQSRSTLSTGSESGTIPTGATKARVVLAVGAHAVWVFNAV